VETLVNKWHLDEVLNSAWDLAECPRTCRWRLWDSAHPNDPHWHECDQFGREIVAWNAPYGDVEVLEYQGVLFE
jgi:hypothetical protein